MNLRIIIMAPRFDENIGGIIVLHYLCHLLNKRGIESFLWPVYKPVFNRKNPLKSCLLFAKYFKKSIHRSFSVKKGWNTPIANYGILKNQNTVVLYSEIVDGNPLLAKNVIRWLLHKPGFFTGKCNFNDDELFFSYNEDFASTARSNINFNLLNIKYIMTDIYKLTNSEKRDDCCFMIRKSKNKNYCHPSNCIQLDGKSHSEIAEIFNRSKVFYSYDPYTYYSVYAVLCGCISVVVPDESTTKDEWYSEEVERYGLAYGLDDIEWAMDTKYLLIDKIKFIEEQNYKSIDRFIEIYTNFFGKNKGEL